jgi:hypothetical protein
MILSFYIYINLNLFIIIIIIAYTILKKMHSINFKNMIISLIFDAKDMLIILE